MPTSNTNNFTNTSANSVNRHHTNSDIACRSIFSCFFES